MMDAEKLEHIIENHRHWLNENVDGWEDMHANLSEANLCETNLRRTNLRYANLRGAKNVP